VLGQIATLVELGKAHRHTASNGGDAIACGRGAKVQALCACGMPRQNLCALLRHKHAVAVGQGPAPTCVALVVISR